MEKNCQERKAEEGSCHLNRGCQHRLLAKQHERLPTPTLLGAALAARMSRLQSRSFSIRIFEQKRDCSQSTVSAVRQDEWRIQVDGLFSQRREEIKTLHATTDELPIRKEYQFRSLVLQSEVG